MAVTEIPWGDGSSDKIYLTYASASGDQAILVSSDANTGNARSKTVTFTSGVGNIIQQLTVNQEAGREPIPGEDGYTWCYYDVTTTGSATTLLNNTTGISGNMIVDGVSKTLATSYTFSTTGIHLVKFKDRATSNNSRFNGCARLKECYLQDGLTTIPYRMFRNCTSLEKVQSFTSLTTPGSNGQYFNGCSSLKTIILPGLESVSGSFGGGENIEIIELEGIISCGVTSSNVTTFAYGQKIVIGPNCTMVGNRCFLNNTYLRELVVKATTVPTMYANALNGTSSSLKIYVPYSADHSVLGAYKAANRWSDYSSQIYELTPAGEIPT